MLLIRDRLAWLALGVAFLTGCGGSDVELSSVEGNVTYAGKPVVYGQIDFVPNRDRGHPGGPLGRAGISNGRYSTAEGGTGIVPGPHHVRITAYDQVPPPTPEVVDETQPYEAPKPIFSGYTMEIDVEGGTKDIEVPENAKGFGVGPAAIRRPVNEP